MEAKNALRQIKRFDESRSGIPGEHWLTLTAGIAAWWLTRNHSSFIVRTAGMAMGTALVSRAASGRDGVAKVLRYLPVGHRIDRH